MICAHVQYGTPVHLKIEDRACIFMARTCSSTVLHVPDSTQSTLQKGTHLNFYRVPGWNLSGEQFVHIQLASGVPIVCIAYTKCKLPNCLFARMRTFSGILSFNWPCSRHHRRPTCSHFRPHHGHFRSPQLAAAADPAAGVRRIGTAKSEASHPTATR